MHNIKTILMSSCYTQGVFLPHQSVQVGACSRGGFLLGAVGSEGPPVAARLFGGAFGASRSRPRASTTLEHLK